MLKGRVTSYFTNFPAWKGVRSSTFLVLGLKVWATTAWPLWLTGSWLCPLIFRQGLLVRVYIKYHHTLLVWFSLHFGWVGIITINVGSSYYLPNFKWLPKMSTYCGYSYSCPPKCVLCLDLTCPIICYLKFNPFQVNNYNKYKTNNKKPACFLYPLHD